ncbi:hypothetical protein [Methanoculleus chikugoensis]|uniref:hypothetical protein n=1 Tax=Methanoculleus chikugoensis TaxID=118126 RepID=UPI00117E99CC|nr:hypothetical protein [Methanoculleus chikugoensis]
MENEIDRGRAELQSVKDNWQSIIDQLTQDPNKQISPDEARRIRLKLDLENSRLNLFYASGFQDHNFDLDVESVMNQLDMRLEVALLAGKRNYDKEMHQRKIETILTWGRFFKRHKV